MARGRAGVDDDEVASGAGGAQAGAPADLLDRVNLLAGLLPAKSSSATAGRRPAPTTQPMTVTVDDRRFCAAAGVVRRLIRTAVLRPIVIDGQIRVRRAELDSYRTTLGIGTPDKPSE
jgi:hypothetical protein